MDSIILEPAIKDMLLADCKDFLHSEDWYVHYLDSASAGIKYQRSIGMLKGVS